MRSKHNVFRCVPGISPAHGLEPSWCRSSSDAQPTQGDAQNRWQSWIATYNQMDHIVV